MEKEALNRIFIGTSGWSYDDWVGKFYPESLKSNKFLAYYSQYFNTVEINFSYYKMPNKYVLNAILRNVPSDFVFTIKLHSSFTHQQGGIKPYEEVPLKERDEFLSAIDVMSSKSMLETLLAQFPQSFHFSHENLEYISKLKKAFQSYNLSIEFRNSGWYNDVVFDIFKRENITFVSVDEPLLRGLPPRDFILTNRIGYIRFHSRDANKWYEGEKLRYDYYYSDEELREWIEKIMDNPNFDKLYVFFNNCHNGQAVQNALRFKRMLSQYF